MPKYVDQKEALGVLQRLKENYLDAVVTRDDEVYAVLMKAYARVVSECQREIGGMDTIKADGVITCSECLYAKTDRSGRVVCVHWRHYGTHAADVQPDDYCSYAEKYGGRYHD